REHREDIAVLAVELELDLRLVPLEILSAHPVTPVSRLRRCGGVAVTSIALLLDLRRLPHALPPVVELGTPHVATRDPVDAGDDRRVHRERALHADAEADLAHGEGLPAAAALAPDDDTLEDLHALAVAFDHPDVHLHGVAGRELWD